MPTAASLVRALSLAITTPALFSPAIAVAHSTSHQGLNITDTHIEAPFDKVPRLCSPTYGAITHTSVGSGPWSAPSTWNTGTVPGAGARVTITPGTTVTYDTASEAAVGCIEVADGARLEFATSQNTKLVLDDGLYVMPQGALTIGTAQSPVDPAVTAEVVFADTPLKTNIDPQQYGKALVVVGDLNIYGAAKSPTFTRVTADPQPGDTTLTLVDTPTGWRVGDTLAIPDSRAVTFDPADRGWEEVTIAAINGNQVTLTSPIQFAHPGSYNNDGTPAVRRDGQTLKVHVANLTRNVHLYSANPDDPLRRGHGLMLHRAQIRVHNAWFDGMDRTLARALDNSKFDAQGNVTHIGTNQIGRYALHLHHLWGPLNPSNTGYQFEAVGNSFTNGNKWMMTVHDSHFGLVKDNVFWRGTGANLALEDGSEYQNEVIHNFSAVADENKIATNIIDENGNPAFDFLKPEDGGLGYGIWMAGGQSTLTDNVIANVARAQLGVHPLKPEHTVNVPLFRGADPRTDGRPVKLHHTGVTVNNLEVYGPHTYEGEAVDVWHLGMVGDPDHTENAQRHRVSLDAEPNVYTDLTAWNLPHRVIGNYYEGVSELIRPFIRGDRSPIDRYRSKHNSGIGMANGPGSVGLSVTDIDCEGFGQCISLRETSGSLRVNGGRMSATFAHIAGNYFFAIGTDPETMTFDNITFETNAINPNVKLFHGEVKQPNAFPESITITNSTVHGQPNTNLQMFAREQAPDAIMTLHHNSPFQQCEGLTNQSCWDQHGGAIFGEVAHCATTRPDVTGFACPLDTPNVQNITNRSVAGTASTPVGPILHWTFDDQNGTATDVSGHGNDGPSNPADNQSPRFSTDTPPTTFPNTHAYGGRSLTTDLNIYNPDGYTISAWVKHAPDGRKGAIWKGHLANEGRAVFAFLQNLEDGRLKLTIRHEHGPDPDLLNITTTNPILDGAWHHILWTDASGDGQLYIDGVPEGQDYSYRPYFTEFMGPLEKFSILRHSCCQPFRGDIDDVRVYNRTLLPAEAAQLATGEEGSTSAAPAASQLFNWQSSDFAKTTIEYGTTSFTNTAPAIPTTRGQRLLGGLLPGTDYQARLVSTFPNGQQHTSPLIQFTTAGQSSGPLPDPPTPTPSPTASPDPTPSPDPEPEPDPQNGAPTFSFESDSTTFTIDLGQTFFTLIGASDPDGDPVTLTIPNLETLLPGAVFQ